MTEIEQNVEGIFQNGMNKEQKNANSKFEYRNFCSSLGKIGKT